MGEWAPAPPATSTATASTRILQCSTKASSDDFRRSARVATAAAPCPRRCACRSMSQSKDTKWTAISMAQRVTRVQLAGLLYIHCQFYPFEPMLASCFISLPPASGFSVRLDPCAH